jgi:NADH:ubiquinone oxidoreductase subunit 4 (subunit M)
MMQRVFHGPLADAWAGFSDLSVGERVRLGIPVGLMLLLGIYPDLVLRLTNTTVLQLARV